ncbi:MAG: PilN domain-containing protein [Sulfuriferula sp.]|nr:PilN domain-containing protein [Sulfuriferula sp.]
MIRINLLPYREMQRAARLRQFSVLLGFVALAAIGVIVVGYLSWDARIQIQAHSNDYLKTEIAKLDKDIAVIKELKEQTAALLSRKQVVESLQTNRASVVHLLDELVRDLPDGVYLRSIKQAGTVISLQGYAQSSARVSTLMRALDASPWLEGSQLIEIKSAMLKGNPAQEFSLTVNLVQPNAEPTHKDTNNKKEAKS